MNDYDSPPFDNRSRNRGNSIALVLMSLGVFIIIAILKGIVEGARHRWIWENYRGYIVVVIVVLIVWIIYSVLTTYFSRHKPATAKPDRAQLGAGHFHDEQAPNPAVEWQRNPLEHDELFEGYVAKRLVSDGYKIIAWRGDKRIDGLRAEATLQPDLLAEYANRRLAIECKWRNHYHSGGIEWAREDQWLDFREFAREKKIPVYVIIGIGGKPGKPSDVYVVPLDKIKSIRLSTDFLKDYQKMRGKLIVNIQSQHYD